MQFLATLAAVNQRSLGNWLALPVCRCTLSTPLNTSLAQIHALLFIVGKPMAADEITETLGVARSNVSNSLKELQGWGLISIVHIMGDRRDHFETLGDVWALARNIFAERKHREFDLFTSSPSARSGSR